MVRVKQEEYLALIEPDDAVVKRARAVAAKLAERASDVDQARAIPPETVRELHEAGLLTMTIPKSLGGTEANLVTQLSVYELIGGACASTAWCVGNHAGICHRLQGTMGDDALPYLQAVVDEGAVLAQGIVPAGTTQAAPGGFVVTGRWPFVSFSNHARWVFLNTTAPGPSPGWQPADGQADPPASHRRQLIVNLSDPGVHIEPTWQAMSLRASMSNDLVLEEVFVSEERALADRPVVPVARWNTNAPVALRVPARLRIFSPSMALGIAQAALRETIDYAKARTISLGGQSRSSMPGTNLRCPTPRWLSRRAAPSCCKKFGQS